MDIWGLKHNLFLAYCLYFRPIFKERQRDVQIYGNFGTRMIRIPGGWSTKGAVEEIQVAHTFKNK